MAKVAKPITISSTEIGPCPICRNASASLQEDDRGKFVLCPNCAFQGRPYGDDSKTAEMRKVIPFATDAPAIKYWNEARMRRELRTIVRGYFDLQKLRISTGNRIVKNLKLRLGVQDGQKEEDADPKAKEIMAKLRNDYKLISQAITENREVLDLPWTAFIATRSEYALIQSYLVLEAQEIAEAKEIGFLVGQHKITKWLFEIRGVGPGLAGILIGEYNPYTAPYPSSFWKMTGLDVGPDGRGRGRYAAHLVVRPYRAADGKMKNRKSLTFNPWVKTKMIGVLGTSFIKQPAAKCLYRMLYDGYKHRLMTDPNRAELSPKHVHAMATRYIVKRFLADFWAAWRKIEGLPDVGEYAEAKLNIHHTGEIPAAQYGKWTTEGKDAWVKRVKPPKAKKSKDDVEEYDGPLLDDDPDLDLDLDLDEQEDN